MRILVVEDDEFTTRSLIAATVHQNYVVELATDDRTAWELIEAFPFDLMVLDMGIPGLDALALCRQVRSQGYQFPILLLTNQTNGHQKALGLDAGADDSVVKPFDPEELEARIRALLRRGAVQGPPILQWGELQLDPSTCEVKYGKHFLALTPKEYALLELFMRHHHRVFSYALILEQVWSYEEIPGEDAVRTHIKGLRQKLKSVGAPGDLIETVYGIGYRLKPHEGRGAGERGKHRQHNGRSQPETMPRSPEESPGDQLRQQTLAAIAGVWERYNQRVDGTVGPNIGTSTVVQSTALHPALNAKVLLVDNDSHILTLVHTLLEPWGLHVTTLDDSAQFWQVLQDTTPDLVILDLDMPSPNGYELCHAMRESDRWSYLPVMILTAYTDSNAVNQLFAVGADDFINKPFVGPELITRVINRLERVRLLRRLSERCPIAQIDPKMVCPFQPDRFFNLSHDLLCTIGLDGQFRQVNPAFEQTLGYLSADVLGHSFLEFVHTDDREQTLAAFVEAKQGTPMIDFTNRYRCRDGSYQSLSWHSVPVLEENVIYAIAHAI